jgi:glycogen operon protein
MKQERRLIYLILNAYWELLEFELPVHHGGPWQRWIDTGLDSPMDIVPWQHTVPVSGASYRAQPRSVVVLFADAKNA